MDDLSYLFPIPEPVSLGGESYQAVCFQLRDLARLQSIVKVLSGDPLAGRRDRLIKTRIAAGGDYLKTDEPGRAYAAELRPAIKALSDWPPLLGSKKADEWLWRTAAGQVLWLVTLLERTNPGFTAADAQQLLSRITAEEWPVLSGIAYADAPADWLGRLMDPLPRRKKPVSWGETIERLSAERGWTYEQVGALYLSQWYAIQCGGKHEPGEIVLTNANAGWYRTVMARHRALMNGQADH